MKTLSIFVLLVLSLNVANAQWEFNYTPVVPYSFASSDGYVFMGTYYQSTLLNFPVYISEDNGLNWKPASQGIPLPCTCYKIFVHDGIVFAGVNNGRLYKSTDYGDSWVRSDSGITNSSAVYDITCYNDTLYAKTIEDIYISGDNGVSWEFLAKISGLKLAVSKMGIFAGGLIVQGLYWSKDRGNTWTHKATFSSDYCQVISLYSSDDYILLGCNNTNTGSGPYESYTIKMREDGTYSTVLNSQAYDFLLYEDRIYMVTIVGVYGSQDQGITWLPFYNGLPGYTSDDGRAEFANPHNLKAICYSNGYLFSGGRYIKDLLNGGGIWRRPISELTAVENTPDLPLVASYALLQNYPNPFNPSTVIEFFIPESGYVKLILYNSLGEKIAELLNSFLLPGRHQLRLNGNELSSGVYFYALKTKNHNAVKKMLLLK